MSDQQQPELRWAPLPPKPSRAGRVWLIVGLSVAALVIVGVVLFFLIPRGGTPRPTGSPAPSTSATPTPTSTSTPDPEPSLPVVTSPPTVDPDLAGFRSRVQVWLDDAGQSLDLVSSASGQDALPVVDTMIEDAQRLSESQPPSSIYQQWVDGVSAYSQKLTALRSAVSSGTGVSAAVDAARTASQELRTLVGL
ncbi:hypothetical protein [Streptomyces sp. AC495_CC817]|uniref:hypothetical protein n=1 Tax=Streptomyces sp. AC495_CC817 TaxID=2823900 RepID=UPI001C25DB46|nr:hypothetical protein [Streptomyces sp. AC495_CC817]